MSQEFKHTKFVCTASAVSLSHCAHHLPESRIISTAKCLVQLNSSQLMHSTVEIVVSSVLWKANTFEKIEQGKRARNTTISPGKSHRARRQQTATDGKKKKLWTHQNKEYCQRLKCQCCHYIGISAVHTALLPNRKYIEHTQTELMHNVVNMFSRASALWLTTLWNFCHKSSNQLIIVCTRRKNY